MIPSDEQLDFTMKLFDLNQVRQRTALYGRTASGSVLPCAGACVKRVPRSAAAAEAS